MDQASAWRESLMRPHFVRASKAKMPENTWASASRCFPTAIAGLAILVSLSAGCSDGRVERVQVSGKVLIDGEPLTTGYIRVYPEGARDSNSNLDSEGRFELRSYNPGDGVPLGTHAVTVSGSELIGTRKIKWNAPPRYAKVSSSGLTLEVTGSTEDAVIELTWGKKGKPFIQK